MQGQANDRYEPLPGLFELPGFLWRKLPRAGKVVVALAGLAAVATAIALSPVIAHSKKEHAEQEAARLAHIRQAEAQRIRREQRPRFGHGTPAGRNVAARGRLVEAVKSSIQSDASTRAAAGEFNGPIKRVQCAPFPPEVNAVPADRVPSRATGRYACLAVTSDIPSTDRNPSGVLGHPYRTLVDFRTGRYAFCKVSGLPGEKAIREEPPVTLPRVCG